MQSRGLRYVVLIGLLVAGVGMYAAMNEPNPTQPARWPKSDVIFSADQWTTSPESVDQANGATFVTRSYMHANATATTLTVVTNPSVKLFAAGVEVPFLGTGYEVGPASLTLVPPAAGRQALIAERGGEQWLVLYAYGERRGLLGNGPLGWGMAMFDSLLGRPNDYYKLYLTTALQGNNEAAARDSAELADTLFPRIVNWYAA